ncbi:hypothetical protein KSP39_PZI019128 [Platanthera zijinensis]|uniref:Uncharacterized protein n=1 Tax=Platanthera zijinensis TaxID=2320716 RepID=A0AAP0FYC6_9ASPA
MRELEGGLPCGRVRSCSQGPQDGRELLHPVALQVLHLLLEQVHDDLVRRFHLAVAPGVMDRGKPEVNPQLGAEADELFTGKLRTVIRHYRLG